MTTNEANPAPSTTGWARTGKGAGLLKGLGVTLKHMLKPAVTQQYPHQRPDLPPRTRGVIALMEENCTVCMLCSRECPDWCIYIDSHKEQVPPQEEGGRARTRNVLDRFGIDFALCMYCGICIEVCPFDALFWSPEFEYSTYVIGELLHEKERLREWMDTVPPPPALEAGAIRPAEVTKAVEKAQQDQAKAQQAVAAASAPAAPAAGGAAAGTAGVTRRPEDDIHVEAQIDQTVYDALIAEGKSERIARSKAKAAYVRAEKQRILAEQGGGGDAAAPAAEPAAESAPEEPKKAEIHVEAGEMDQAVYDALIAEGKSERIARSKAKAAWVRAKRQELAGEGE